MDSRATRDFLNSMLVSSQDTVQVLLRIGDEIENLRGHMKFT